MAVLVVNCGSSSVKYRLFAIDGKKVGDCLAEGLVERIGTPDSRSKYKAYKRLPSAGAQFAEPCENIINDRIADHESALRLVLSEILHKDHGVLGSVDDVKVVGHRVVHGADTFQSTTVLTPDVVAKIRECCKYAPLHNPVNLLGIEACQKLFPHAVQTGVFDTAFHATMPKHAYLYAIPYSLYEKHRIRRYGFHGTSHRYVSRTAAEILRSQGKSAEKLIVCHIGNGASICAVLNGKSVDTTMGFTPLEGLIMGTRAGDIDAGAVLALHALEGLNFEEIDTLLNKKSGLLGITEESSDSLVMEIKALEGHERFRLAMTMHNYRVTKYIGAYAAAMGGVDAIIFTGGVGENSAIIREEVCAPLAFLGVEFDKDVNNKRSREPRFISKPTSKVAVMVVPTNEELEIACESVEVAL